jgi:hypothetical protein
MFDIQPRTWRLAKLTAMYLVAILFAIAATVSGIAGIVVYIGPLALVGVFGVILLIIPALHYAKKRLKHMEEIERETERRLKKDW